MCKIIQIFLYLLLYSELQWQLFCGKGESREETICELFLKCLDLFNCGYAILELNETTLWEKSHKSLGGMALSPRQRNMLF